MKKALFTLMAIIAIALPSCQTTDPTSFEVEITPEFINAVRQYDDICEFSEGLAVVEKDDKYGYINVNGELVIPCKYRFASSFENGMASVRDSLGVGAINRKGEIVVPCEYDGISYNDGMFRLEKNDLYGFANENGEIVIPCKYEHAGIFSDGLVSVTPNKGDDLLDFLNDKGETVIKSSYHANLPHFIGSAFPDATSNDYMPKFKNGICLLIEQEPEYREFYIDKRGELVDSDKANSLLNQVNANDMYSNNKHGYIEFTEPINSYDIEPDEFVGLKDSLNNVVVPAKYTHIYPFVNGVALALLSNEIPPYDRRGGITLKGYVDKKGNTTFTDEDYMRFYADRKRLNEVKEEKERKEREIREHPERLFNSLMRKNAWRSYNLTVSGLGYRDYLETIITLRPKTENYGEATVVGWVNDRRAYNRSITSDDYYYTISGQTLIIENHSGSNSNWMPLVFEIKGNGDDEVTLHLLNPSIEFNMIPKSKKLVPTRYKL